MLSPALTADELRAKAAEARRLSLEDHASGLEIQERLHAHQALELDRAAEAAEAAGARPLAHA